ncbi:MAG TPA: VOC family protein, partial [Candidatus Limnocylindrales bacterium]|nr:VOC family protein [Candidatus Limnocylindrales bacterium]
MFLGIDHLVIAVADPDDAASELASAIGLEATGGGRHESLGTHNRLIWFGDSFVELIGVFDPALARQSWIGPPTLEALDAGGGFVTWAIVTDSLEHDAVALRAVGADLTAAIDGERRRPDGGVVRWRLSKPGRLGPAEPPFLIEHDPASAEWTQADRAARAGQHHPIGGPVRLEVLELLVDDMSGMIQRLTRSAGLRFRPSLAGGGARDAAIGGQT